MLHLTRIDLDLVFALDDSSDTLTYHGCHKGRPFSGIYLTPILNRY